jgi:hypothetical protein
MELVEQLNVSPAEKSRLIKNLEQCRFHLKSDYKLHVSKESLIADHCSTFALSDTKDSNFREKFSHEHTDTCEECLILTNTLYEIEKHLNSQGYDQSNIERELVKFQLLKEPILQWKAHSLTSVNQDLCRDELLENLPEDAFYMYLDFAMKFLPAKYREGQEFFGKKSLTWHISVVLVNNPEKGKSSSEFLFKVFVHIFDNVAQDSFLVTAIMKDVLSCMKAKNSYLKYCFVRSDNAGAYHSAQTILSLPTISEETKISIKQFDFCGPQSGKGPCDCYAAVIKSHIQRYINEQNNVTNATGFNYSVCSNGGLNGVEIFESFIDMAKKFEKASSFPKIGLYNNFRFTRKGLLVHRAYNMGPGKLFSFNELKPLATIPKLKSHVPEKTSDRSISFAGSKTSISEPIDISQEAAASSTTAPTTFITEKSGEAVTSRVHLELVCELDFGLEAVRFYLMREVPFGNDGNYSRRALIGRMNTELANDFGNLAQRSLSLLQ